jgi:biopolymer transport protein ExbB
MKLVSVILALVVGATVTFGQAPTPEPVTTIGDRGANAGRPATGNAVVESTPAGGDTTRIKSPAASPIPGDEPSTPVSLLKLIRSGGWAMIPLGIMSVVTFMLVLVNLFTLRRSAILTPHYMNTADVLLKKKDYLGLLAISSRHSEAVARVVQRTLDFSTKNPGAPFEIVKEIAESEGSGQAAALQHRPTYLADIGMLSPMVGLLGTVSGLIQSFGVLAAGTAIARSRDVMLAEGVSEALVATATGLVLGIICFAFYAHFRNKAQALISDLEVASAHIVGLVALNYSKKREATRAALEEEF